MAGETVPLCDEVPDTLAVDVLALDDASVVVVAKLVACVDDVFDAVSDLNNSIADAAAPIAGNMAHLREVKTSDHGATAVPLRKLI